MKDYVIGLQSYLPWRKHKRQKILKSRYNHRLISVNSILLLLIFYFIFHSLSGERGVFALIKLNRELAEKKLILDDILAEKLLIENRVKLLYPKSLDLDLLDEIARNDLGMVGEGEKVLILKK